MTQGVQSIALMHLDAATVSRMLQFTSVVVVDVGVPAMGERPNAGQLAGITVLPCGVVAYFYPIAFPAAERFGSGVMVVGVFGNAVVAVLGHRSNREDAFSTLAVTTVSMTVGSLVLLATGVRVEGMPWLTWYA